MNRSFVDQLGSTIVVPSNPKRIISLVPSQTELLYDLDLGDRVVGITKFCIHPKRWFETKTRVGGTKKIAIEKVIELQPDLIIGNKEENTKEDIEKLRKIAPVWLSDINTFDSALEMIDAVGALTNTGTAAEALIGEIKRSFESITLASDHQAKRVRYLIWKDPYYQAGRSTFIDALIQKIGWINCTTEERYPEWNGKDDSMDYLLLSSEPYPFSHSDVEHLQQLFPSVKVILVDGELFSWYGSRMRLAPVYFQRLIDQLAC
jgi:ABC-type Fe3+-hydroxamate transport system substrate-binding protein